MIRNKILMLCILIFANVSAFADSCPCFFSNQIGLLIPFYIYPTSSYAQVLINTRKQYPNVPMLVIINPNNGVGTAKDPNYVTFIQQLHAAGAFVLGYVYTSYGQRAFASVETEVNTWQSWYAIDGFFVDEMGTNHNYYGSLTAYMKYTGAKIVVGNPGTYLDPSYSNDVDIVNIYEDSSVPTLSNYAAWSGLNAKMSFLVYDINSLNATFVQNAAAQFNWMYITNDNLPNPWDTLPPYFNTLVATISQINVNVS